MNTLFFLRQMSQARCILRFFEPWSTPSPSISSSFEDMAGSLVKLVKPNNCGPLILSARRVAQNDAIKFLWSWLEAFRTLRTNRNDDSATNELGSLKIGL